MCGIAGIFSKEKKYNQNISILLDDLNKRGPDYNSYKVWNENLTLGHTRLSIIDLTSKSNQPMESYSKNSYISFNGEIYNYQDLKKKYFLNFPFKTDGDTELVLEGLEKYGITFLDEIRGFYSIAFLKKNTNEIFLLKDPVGKKPLFYYFNNNNLIFSSKINGIKLLLGSDELKEINNNGLAHYFWKGYFIDENTIYKNVKALKPGFCFKYNYISNEHKIFKFCNEIRIKCSASRDARPLALIENELEKSLMYRNVSDVDISYLLSGGIDSSLLCFLASKKKKISTYYASFEKKNEFDVLSQKLSEIIKSNHNVVNIKNVDLDTVLKKNFQIFHEPFADYSSIPSYLIYKEVAKKYKVVITGDGADEFFGGYQDYKIFLLKNKIGNIFKIKNINFFYKILDKFNFLPKKLIYMISILFLEDHNICHLLSNNGWNLYFRKEYMNKDLFDKYFSDNTEKKLSNKFSNAGNNSLERSLNFYLDRLKFNYLVKVDGSSMENSLEARCPFLDIFMINRLSNINPEMIMSLSNNKKELKSILDKNNLSFLTSKKKEGFTPPLKSYMLDKKNVDVINQILESGSIVTNYFDKKKIERLISSKENIEKNYYRIWILLVFHYWKKSIT